MQYVRRGVGLFLVDILLHVNSWGRLRLYPFPDLQKEYTLEANFSKTHLIPELIEPRSSLVCEHPGFCALCHTFRPPLRLLPSLLLLFSLAPSPSTHPSPVPLNTAKHGLTSMISVIPY